MKRLEKGHVLDLEGNIIGFVLLPPKRNVRPIRKDGLFERDLEKKERGSAGRCSIDLPK